MGASGLSAVNMSYIITILAYIVLAPVIGLIVAYIVTIIILHICKNARPAVAERWFKRLQLVSSAALSFAHGGNDAQKVMGILYVAIVTAKIIKPGDVMPNWIPLACYSAIALGTLSGGWKIVKTMGSKITKITPLDGIPVSTTHTITGSIIGVGLTKRLSAVRWGLTINIIWAWVITIPVSALISAGIFAVLRVFVK